MKLSSGVCGKVKPQWESWGHVGGTLRMQCRFAFMWNVDMQGRGIGMGELVPPSDDKTPCKDAETILVREEAGIQHGGLCMVTLGTAVVRQVPNEGRTGWPGGEGPEAGRAGLRLPAVCIRREGSVGCRARSSQEACLAKPH